MLRQKIPLKSRPYRLQGGAGVAWHTSGNRQGTRRQRRTLTGQGWDTGPPCRCRTSGTLGFCRCPACRTARTSGNGLVVVTTPKGRAWFDSMQTTTGSSEVEQSRKGPDAGSNPAHSLRLQDWSIRRRNGRKTTRRTRGQGTPVAQQPQAHAPSAGGGQCQTRAPPAPAASPLPSLGTASRRTARPEALSPGTPSPL